MQVRGPHRQDKCHAIGWCYGVRRAVTVGPCKNRGDDAPEPQEPDRVLKDIGRRIAEIRSARGLTQEAFAEQILGVSLKYVQAIESGRENLGVASLVNLANRVGVRVIDLFAAPASRAVARGRPSKRPTPR